MAGGIDWFRWHHGCVTDPKFQLVARKAGASVAEVVAVWACLLEAASQADERGNPGTPDFEALDCALGTEEGRCEAIYTRMCERGLIADDGRVVAWERRQPKREREDDSSTERVRAFRERQRQSAQGNATERQETPRGEESREEETSSLRSEGRPARKRASATPGRPEDVAEQVWADWLALRARKRAPVTETVLQGAREEAGKAGMPLEEFLRVWCARGSQGMQAAWLRESDRRTAQGGPRSFADADREAGMRRWEQMTGQVHPDRLTAAGAVIDVAGAPQLAIGGHA